MTGTSFPFIVQAGPTVPKEARTQIRKQAMKDAGIARKSRGKYGRVNMRQMPLYGSPNVGDISIGSAVETIGGGSSDSSRASSRIWTPDSSSSGASRSDSDHVADSDEVVQGDNSGNDLIAGHTGNWNTSSALMPFTLNPLPQYERARSRFGVDLVSLSILTNFSVGKSTIATLSADSTKLASLLGTQQSSYLEYVPSRYGINECLTAATNCLLAKAHTVLAPKEESRALCNRLYGRALRSLQDAIGSDSSAMDADVLCATQLLSLHEVLDSSNDTAWSHHVQGSARLVRHRSVSRFRTDFERALFAAHVGGIISECLLHNTHCYLEQPAWTGLYTSLTQETHFLTDRSSLSINCRVAMFPIPGLWHDIGEAVNSDDLFDDIALGSLKARCRASHKGLLDWLEQYKAHCVRLSLAQPPATELALRRELFGSAMECLAVIKRLLAAVYDEDRRSLEVEAQAVAHLILDLQKQPSPKHSWLFSGHEVGIASTILLTKDQWEENVSRYDTGSRLQAVRNRYNAWSNTLRMAG